MQRKVKLIIWLYKGEVAEIAIDEITERSIYNFPKSARQIKELKC